MRLSARLRAASVVAATMLPFAIHAQAAPDSAKALVYCPVAIDAVGCANIAAAVAPEFPGGVDLGYDGTGGTVDLRSADLWRYEVFVVPSLADVGETTPYAFLRDAVVAERLRDALMGRIAMWSGTPDLGSATSPNRDLKNALIASLVRWARGNHATVKGPGLVTFLDQSDAATDRYDWARTITGLNVIADLKLASYSAVSAITPTATAVLANGDGPIAYANMASFGFQTPSGAAGVSLDAVGSTGTSVGGQVVLLTAPGGNTAGATVKTDLDDYPPGMTVVITGSGWLPGETVTLKLHEDPLGHSDRSFTTVADASGNIEFTGFAPEQHDVDVRFILTATGASSGFRAQTTFTDGIVAAGSTTSDNSAGGMSLALGRPAGTIAGDILLAQITVSGGTNVTLTPPPGWNFIVRNDASTLLGQVIYWRIAEFSEPASYTWGFSTPSKAVGGIVRYDGAGVNEVAPIAASSGNNGNGSGGSTTSIVAPSATTTVRSTKVITFFAMRANTTLSTPTLMSELHQRTSSSPLAPAGPTIMASDVDRFETGPTGTNTSTGQGSASWVAQTVALDWRQTGTGSSGNRDLIVTRPPDVTAGDILIANVMFRGDASVTVAPQAGGPTWTLIAKQTNPASPVTQATYWRLAGASEPATYAWRLSSGSRAIGVVTAYSNIDRDNPIDASGASVGAAASTSLVAPSVATTSSGAVVAALYAFDVNSLFTPPPGMVLRYQENSTNAAKLAGADMLQAVGGPSLPKVATTTAATNWVAQTIALRRPVATKLAFVTAARAGFVGECLGPITVQARDNHDRPAVVAVSTPVSFATSGAGVFFTTAGCTVPTAAGGVVTMAAGTNAVTVYYRPSARGSGTHQVSATASGLATASQDQTIDNDPVAPTLAGTLVRTTATSQFSPPSPDPSGIAYASHLDRLIMVDGEVDEMTINAGANVFEATPSGSLARTWTTAPFSTEPVGAAYNPVNRHLFLSDDVANRVFEIDPGSDGEYGTADDRVTSFDTHAFGSDDPEGVAFDATQNVLYIVDGGDTQVYRVSPGPNAIFDGVAPAGDDMVTSFDTEAHGLLDPEGIAFGSDVARLYVVGRPRTRVFEFSPAGAVLNVIDITTAGARNPSGVEYVPATASRPRALYIADRGVDNVTDPNENDGRMYEISLPAASGNYLPVVAITAPATGSVHVAGSTITFTGTATDIEDGNLSPALRWSSNRDGFLGVGASLPISRLTAGLHTITASAKDTRGAEATASIDITIDRPVVPTAVSGITASASIFGGTTDVSATVSPAATGSVSFFVGSSPTPILASYDVATGVATLSGHVHGLNASPTAYPVRAVFTPANESTLGSEATNANALSVAQAPQTIVFDLRGVSARYGDGPIAIGSLVVGGASGNAVLFATESPATCSIEGESQVRVSGAGVCVVMATQAGNANYEAATPVVESFTIAARTLNVTATAADKQYDGTPSATVTLADDRIAGDDVRLDYTGAVFSDANVGTAKPIEITGIVASGTSAANYTVDPFATAVAAITPRPVTGGIVAQDKVYDGTTTAVAVAQPLSGLVTGDVVTLVATNARFDAKTVGARTATADVALAGTAAANYVLGATTASAQASISPRALTVAANAADKTYDGNALAAVTLSDDRLAGDVLTVSHGSATFADRNVGDGKPVTVAGIVISGADAGNYAANITAVTSANVTARALAVSATAIDKVYDGSVAADVVLADDRIAGDAFTTSYSTASFTDANAGIAKTVAVSGISITGADAGNYVANQTAATTASIAARPIAVVADAATKVYGEADPVFGYRVVSGSLVGADAFTGSLGRVAGESVAGSPYAIQQGTLTVGANYQLAFTGAELAVTPRVVSPTIVAADKMYDGGTAASIVASVEGALAEDDIALVTGPAAFADKHAGSAKQVTAAGAVLTGADAGNYRLSATTATTTASIAARALVIAATAQDKTYDGTTAATVALTDDRVAGDAFTVGHGGATFADASAGTNKTVTVAAISLTGADASNYSFNTSATTSATIARRAIAVRADAASKVYGDADPSFTYQLVDGTLVAGETITGSLLRAPGETVAGGPYAINQGSLSAGMNYDLGFTGAALTIVRRPLIAMVAGSDKVYDGTTAATVMTALEGALSADNVAATAGEATFADPNVGSGKQVTATGIALSGTSADNYHLVSTTAIATAAITQRPLAVAANAATKRYGDPDPSLTYTIVGGSLVDGEGLSGALTRAEGETVTGSPYAIGRGSLDAGPNYALAFTDAALTISPRPVTAAIAGMDKVYDGTTTATVVASVSGAVPGDDISALAGPATFADRHVGTAKPVTTSGMTLTGDAAANYELTGTTAATTASITPRPIAVTADPLAKVYGDADPAFSYRITSGSLVAGDAFAGSLARVSGETVAGGPYTISQGSLTAGANYDVDFTAAALTITRRPVTATVVASDKVYDGATAAVVAAALDGALATDDVAVTVGTASFADRNVGDDKPVTAAGMTLAGSSADNYQLTSATSVATARITPRALAITAQGQDKEYDGLTSALVTLADDRLANDALDVAYGAATFADPNVGTAKAIAVSGISLGGADARNYTHGTTAVASASITPRPVAVAAEATTKVYGDADPELAWRIVEGSLVTGESITGALARVAGETVAGGPYAIQQGTLSAGTNYRLTFSGATLSITRRPVAMTVVASDKVYDGTSAASITAALTGAVAGDAVEARFGSATFSDKHVGTARPVTVSGLSLAGAAAANYLLGVTTATTTASITARPLAITATAANKVYDGTTTAVAMLADDRLAGDALVTSYAAARFADANVGVAKPVTVSGIAIAGADARNYTVAPTAQATADITPASATITLGNLSQRWDGAVKAVSATTTPAALGVTLTYSQNGTPVAAPRNAGFYDVVATIADPNYQGSATATLVILNLIDITPGNTLNMISLSDTKTTEILTAVLGTATFDARTVVASSATLGDGVGADAPVNTTSTGAIRSAIADVNGDGRADMVLYFRKTTVISAGSVTTATKELILRATLASGAQIRGADKVTVYP